MTLDTGSLPSCHLTKMTRLHTFGTCNAITISTIISADTYQQHKLE